MTSACGRLKKCVMLSRSLSMCTGNTVIRIKCSNVGNNATSIGICEYMNVLYLELLYLYCLAHTQELGLCFKNLNFKNSLFSEMLIFNSMYMPSGVVVVIK